MVDLSKLDKTKDLGVIKKAEDLIKNIGIPSQPKIVHEINKEVNKIKVDFKLLASLIEKDVALSAKVIKIANSPFFSTRKIETIEQALITLGVSNFKNIVVLTALKESVDKYSSNKDFNDKFFRHSSMVALCARTIAKKIKSPLYEMAYLLGLFHDCAVPLFMKKYKDYSDLVDLALYTVPLEALQGKYKSVIGLEDGRYYTNHCVAGYLVAKSWLLDENICNAICYHHFIDLSIHKNSMLEQLISILLVSEFIVERFDTSKDYTIKKDTKEVKQWAILHRQPISILSIDSEDLVDLQEDIFELLNQVSI